MSERALFCDGIITMAVLGSVLRNRSDGRRRPIRRPCLRGDDPYPADKRLRSTMLRAPFLGRDRRWSGGAVAEDPRAAVRSDGCRSPWSGCSNAPAGSGSDGCPRPAGACAWQSCAATSAAGACCRSRTRFAPWLKAARAVASGRCVTIRRLANSHRFGCGGSSQTSRSIWRIGFGQRESPLLVSLADHAEDHLLRVDCLDGQGDRLADPEAVGVHQGEASAIDGLFELGDQAAAVGVATNVRQAFLKRLADFFLVNRAHS